MTELEHIFQMPVGDVHVSYMCMSFPIFFLLNFWSFDSSVLKVLISEVY